MKCFIGKFCRVYIDPSHIRVNKRTHDVILCILAIKIVPELIIVAKRQENKIKLSISRKLG